MSEQHELSGSSQLAIQRQQELKDTFERRKRARELAVPTNDNAVKLKLREYGQPICLFGEGAPERRDRLREAMAQQVDLDEPVFGWQTNGRGLTHSYKYGFGMIDAALAVSKAEVGVSRAFPQKTARQEV